MADFRIPTGARCRNRRHNHEAVYGPSCLPVVDQDRPLPDRVVGTVIVAGLAGLAAAFVAGWHAGDWLAHEGRVRLELARGRWRSTP